MYKSISTIRHVTTSLLISMIVISCFVDVVSSQIVKPPTTPIIDLCVGYLFGYTVIDNKIMKWWRQKYGWGSSWSGNEILGDNQSDDGNAIPYINVDTDVGIKQVYWSTDHVCMILDTWDMKCHGKNEYGQIGMGITTTLIGSVNKYIGDSLTAMNIVSGLQVLDITLRWYDNYVMVTGNKVDCYGYNNYGHRGYGDTTNRRNTPETIFSIILNIQLVTGSLNDGYVLYCIVLCCIWRLQC